MSYTKPNVGDLIELELFGEGCVYRVKEVHADHYIIKFATNEDLTEISVSFDQNFTVLNPKSIKAILLGLGEITEKELWDSVENHVKANLNHS